MDGKESMGIGVEGMGKESMGKENTRMGGCITKGCIRKGRGCMDLHYNILPLFFVLLSMLPYQCSDAKPVAGPISWAHLILTWLKAVMFFNAINVMPPLGIM